MSDLETTQAKLSATPTAGVEAEHSALYRRYFSSGYKGYIQGTIAGGAFYGSIGLAIGAVVGGILAVTAGPAALLLAPILGVSFGMYGAHAFSGVGTTAAILADSDEHMERRRTLLEQLGATRNPEEIKEITNQLQREEAPKPIEQAFHWRPALVGALLGVTIAVAAVALIPALAPVAPELFGGAFHYMMGHLGLSAASMIMTGGALGALTGGTITGLDRGIVRGVMDHTEFTVNENQNLIRGISERQQDIQRLTMAAERGEAMARQSAEIPAITQLPSSVISEAQKPERLVSLDQALAH